MNDFRSLSLTEKNPLSDCLSVPPPAVDGKLLVLLHLFDGFHRRAMSKTFDESGRDWASLAKEAGVQVWPRKNDTSVINKETISIPQMPSNGSFAGKLFSSSDCMICAVSCCHLFAQDRSLPSVCDIAVAEIVKDIQQHRLLGNREARQVSSMETVYVRLASSDECYEAFICVCKKLFHKKVSGVGVLRICHVVQERLGQRSLHRCSQSSHTSSFEKNAEA